MIRPVTIVAILLSLIAGCSPVPPDFVRKQSITYRQTNITGLSKDKVNADVVFREINRDSVTLDNVSLDYVLYLENQRFTSGSGIRLDFKANDTTDFTVPMEVNYIDFFKTAANLARAELKGKKTISFQLRTVVAIHFAIGSIKIPVTAEGELPMPEVKKPRLRLKL